MSPTTIRKQREKERQRYLELLNQQKKQHNFYATATPTLEPIKPLQLWRYTRNTVMILGVNKKLYALKGNRRFFLKELHPPITNETPISNVIPQESYFSRIAKELDITQEEAYKLSQELAKADEAEFISSFSEIAKERGVTQEEAYNQIMKQTEKETEEFLFQIEKERIAELKELKP